MYGIEICEAWLYWAERSRAKRARRQETKPAQRQEKKIDLIVGREAESVVLGAELYLENEVRKPQDD